MAGSAVLRPLSGIARAFAALRGRLYDAPPVTIEGVNNQNWPTADQPVQPVGPKGSQPLAFPFWQGVNLNITPRPDAAMTFADLRELSQYPLARLCIENVKDQLTSLRWSIQLRELPGQSLAERRRATENDKVIPALTEFMSYPDGETPWADWARPLIEDLLVIDAASILVQQTFSGQVVKLRVPDGAQFLRLIDDQGYTPAPPSPAYTQLWEGIPRVLLTTKQLIYRPSNIAPRTTLASKIYGYSITEQIAKEIRVGSERLSNVLAYYTEGAVPGLVHVVPAGVSPDTITETMQWMNSELAGNLAARRQWRMIQGFRDNKSEKDDQIIQLKDPVLADVFDDVHIRKVCFAYGTSPQRLMKMIRTEGQSSAESATEEGVMPRLKWLKRTMDLIIQKRMGYGVYEMVWNTDTELDAVKQAEVDKTYISIGFETINEARDARGLEPRSEPEANELMIITPTGPVPLAGSIDRTNQAAAAAAQKPNPGEPKPGEQKPEPEPEPKPKKKLAKVSEVRIDPLRTSATIALAKTKAQLQLNRWLHKQARTAAEAVETSELAQRFTKATKPNQSDIDALTEYIAAELAWEDLTNNIVPDLNMAALEGSQFGISDLAITSADVISAINEVAANYARDRAAEMVGMKWVDSTLVPNPDAKWAITESTRNMLRTTLTDAFQQETKMPDLTDAIRQSGAFSQSRAEMIANTEVIMAQVRGNYAAWEKSGAVEEVRWQVSGDHDVEDECDDNEDAGPIKFGDAFPTGDTCPPQHPRCRCILIAAKVKGVQL
jgi:Phage Mu protein F like protein